ncbi:MAG: hypothetical protein SVY10_07570 [Thermodesulfobacteriota bacterium]|nr:hypothetical protein [Thermodesulfobacteriota bacterium]
MDRRAVAVVVSHMYIPKLVILSFQSFSDKKHLAILPQNPKSLPVGYLSLKRVLNMG